MAQIGLKETLSLLAAGYKKKDIEALAAIDEQEKEEIEQNVEEPAKNVEEPAKNEIQENDKSEELQAQLAEKQKELDNLLEQLKANEEKLTKLQQDNIHKDSSPAVAESKKAQQDSLINLVRGFM